MENLELESYIGCKVIKAKKMSLMDYNSKYKPDVKLDGNDVPGYLVKYEDGYISWSPQDTFERAYRKISSGEMNLIME